LAAEVAVEPQVEPAWAPPVEMPVRPACAAEVVAVEPTAEALVAAPQVQTAATAATMPAPQAAVLEQSATPRMRSLERTVVAVVVVRTAPAPA